MIVRGKSRSAAGFTLVEMLVGTVILGVLATTLYSGVRSVYRLHDRTGKLLDLHRVCENASTVLTMDLTNAIRSRLGSTECPEEILCFWTLRSARRPAGIGYAATALVSYTTVELDDERTGLRRVLLSRDGTADTSLFILPRGVALRISALKEEPDRSDPLSAKVLALSDPSLVVLEVSADLDEQADSQVLYRRTFAIGSAL